MARELADTVDVRRRDDGTTVELTRRLTRPVELQASSVIGEPQRGHKNPERLELTSDGDRLLVTGPVNAGTAAELHHEIQRRSRGGTRPLVVDLTGVTHLASAGVAVLHANQGVTLVAPRGTVAQHVLAPTTLAHVDSPDPPERSR